MFVARGPRVLDNSRDHRHLVALSRTALPLAGLFSAACLPQTSGPVEVPIEPAVEIAAAGDHTCARLQNGNAGCWGSNDYGVLGVPLDQVTDGPSWLPLAGDPVALATSAFHGCAVLEGGAVHCWGANPDDLLGRPNGACTERETDGTCVSRPGATLLTSGAVALAAGGRPPVLASSGQDAREPRPLTCALMDSGQVSCWGDNSAGALGTLEPVLERPEPDLVMDTAGFPLRDVVHIAVGADRVYAIDELGEVWFWGGTVSRGARREPLPRARHLAVGQRHSCLVTDGGAVMCWGDNTNGQVGDPDAARFCNPETEDCQLGITRVVGVSRAVEVAVGAHHSCALDLDGRVTCWGSNQHTQLGDEVPSLISGPVVVPLPGKATQVVAGRGHSCAALMGGAVMCWGAGGAGQLGVTL
jgi:alpha-tubulin suppressor-like RCC1 family protein